MSETDNPESTKMLSINDLPEEVWMKVFSYLFLPDLMSVRLVSKQWNELCISSRFTKHETLYFEGDCDLDEIHIDRTLINLKFVSLQNMCFEGFWEEHGSRIKSLKIWHATVEDAVLYNICNFCPDIEDLSFYDAIFGPNSPTVTNCKKLERLVELDINCSDLDDATIGMLTKNVPKLKHFALSNRKQVDMNDETLEDIMPVISTQCDTLETICFSGYDFVNDNFVSSLGDLVGVQLTGLFISNCANVTDDIFETIANKFVNLEVLDVSGNQLLGRNVDPSLFSRLTKLKLVCLKNTRITDPVLSAIAGIEELEGLDVSLCNSLTADGISRALGSKLHETLLDIRLGNVRCVTDQVLTQILPQLPNLRSIDLTNCVNITAAGASTITNNCKLLRILFLTQCSHITEVNLLAVKGLLALSLAECPLDQKSLIKIKYLDLQLINLVKTPFTHHNLKLLLTNCPSLSRVELSCILGPRPSIDGHILLVVKNDACRTKRAVFVREYCLPGTIFKLSKSHFNSYA